MDPDENACALPLGTLLHEYQIKSVLGIGNFGITYLAYDSHLQMAVAIKEYFPSNYAIRKPDHSTAARSSADEQDFLWGLDRFRQEAQTLARFHHPNIVRVLRLVEANSTCYMVMEFEEGNSLEAFYTALEGPPTEDRLNQILLPLLDGLLHVHKAGLMHRDIKPANIYLRTNGTPVLLDFGSAREALRSHAPNLTTLITPGFAPLEQYSSDGNQGPWSDIYALGGVFYLLATGKMPIEAPSRAIRDRLVPARLISKGRFSDNFLRAIDRALAVNESDRLQDIEAWLSTINERPGVAEEPEIRVVAAVEATIPVEVGQPLLSRQQSTLLGVFRNTHFLISTTSSLIVICLIVLHALDLYDIQFIDRLETTTYDWRLQLMLPSTGAKEVAIVAIDDKSLGEVGRWPWDRDKIAKLTDALFQHYDVQVVGLDMMFPEPSQAKQNDDALAKSLIGRRVVLGYVFTPDISTAGSLPAPVENGQALRDAGLILTEKTGYVGNLPELMRSTTGSGFTNIVVDFDNVVRRLPMLIEHNGNAYQAFSLAVLHQYLGSTPTQLSRAEIRIGDVNIPTGDLQSSVMVPYLGRKGTFDTYSASDILEQRIEPSKLSGKIVLVGANAVGLGDYHATPMKYPAPGVEIQANMIEGALLGLVKVAAFKPAYEPVIVLLLGIAAMLAFQRLSSEKLVLVALGFLLALVLSSLLSWAYARTSIPLASSVTLLLALCVTQLSTNRLVMRV